jgi:hypothetical protein
MHNLRELEQRLKKRHKRTKHILIYTDEDEECLVLNRAPHNEKGFELVTAAPLNQRYGFDYFASEIFPKTIDTLSTDNASNNPALVYIKNRLQNIPEMPPEYKAQDHHRLILTDKVEVDFPDIEEAMFFFYDHFYKNTKTSKVSTLWEKITEYSS